MKLHSTNYSNTFIEAAEDCPETTGQKPPTREDKKTVANYQFDLLFNHPYEYTSDDIIFTIHAIRNEIPKNQWQEKRIEFFSKGQPCFRSSPLTKRYGWGVHSDTEGKVALYAVESKEYTKFVQDDRMKRVKAMASKRN